MLPPHGLSLYAGGRDLITPPQNSRSASLPSAMSHGVTAPPGSVGSSKMQQTQDHHGNLCHCQIVLHAAVCSSWLVSRLPGESAADCFAPSVEAARPSLSFWSSRRPETEDPLHMGAQRDTGAHGGPMRRCRRYSLSFIKSQEK